MATSDRSVTFIGTGNMGEAVPGGDLHQERVDHITAHYGVHGTTSNRAAAAEAGLVVIGVEPEEIAPVLDEIAETISETAVVISLAGRVSTTDLEEHLRAGAAVIRVAPNTAALAPGQTLHRDTAADRQ